MENNSNTKTVAVIIPCYNEENSVKRVILDFHAELPEATIVLVNNNSTDDTAKLALEAFAEIETLPAGKKILLNEWRQGKAFAVKKAFAEINADYFVLVDGDMSGDSATQVHSLMEPVLSGKYDVVVGDRHKLGDYKKENRRPFHNFGNRLVVNTINRLYKSDLNDVLSGYRVMNELYVKNLPILSKGFEIETEMSVFAQDKGFRTLEVPYRFQERPDGGESKVNTVTDGIKIMKTIFTLFKEYRPLLFFGTIGIVCFVISLIIGIPILVELVQTRNVTSLGVAILTSGLAIFSLIFFSIGVILDSIVKIEQKNFELRKIDFLSRNK